MINVSYFFQFQDDPTTEVVESKANLQRAAAILFAAGEFRKDVCSGNLPADRIGKKQIPLCSTPYKYMFNACRIPQSKMDAYRIYDPSRYNHCVIARNGHFFSIDIIHPETGNPLPVQTLERQLQECIESADARPPGQLGLLTSLNRDSWSTAREQLLKAGGVAMEEALEKIESGAFLLSLDDTAPVSRDECCENLLTGGKASGNNRWFDKSIQLLVSKNGKAGILGEHSMMDGMVLINVSNHITNTTYADATKRSQVMVESPTNVKDIFAEAVAGINESVVGPLIDEGKPLWLLFHAYH